MADEDDGPVPPGQFAAAVAVAPVGAERAGVGAEERHLLERPQHGGQRVLGDGFGVGLRGGGDEHAAVEDGPAHVRADRAGRVQDGPQARGGVQDAGRERRAAPGGDQHFGPGEPAERSGGAQFVGDQGVAEGGEAVEPGEFGFGELGGEGGVIHDEHGLGPGVGHLTLPVARPERHCRWSTMNATTRGTTASSEPVMTRGL